VGRAPSTARARSCPLAPSDPARSPDGIAVAESVAGAYSAYHAELGAFLRRVIREPEAADDLAQEAFLRLQRALLGGRGPDNTRAWLYRVAANLAISRGRRLAVARRHPPGSTDLLSASECSPEDRALAAERWRGVDGALASLSAEARLGLTLAAQGFSGREIATLIGRSEVATRTMLCRTRLRLREQLLREELESHDGSR
jgi:RNA polymerase sigma-70 factor (ECF subfamily)